MELEPLSSPNQIDKHWLKVVLSKYYQTQITIEKLRLHTKDSDGFLSDIVYFDVITKEKDILSICIKLMPNDLRFRKFVTGGCLAEKEALVYQFFESIQLKTMIKETDIFPCIPEMVYCRYSKENFTMVMKNMSYGEQPFQNLCAYNGADLHLTVKAIEAISVIHAISSVYIETNGLGILEKLTEYSKRNDALEIFCKSGLKQFLNLSSCKETKEILTPLLSPEKILTLFETREKDLPRCLLHGDYWIGQILQNPQSKKVCILDWQFSIIGSPASDIAMFLLKSSLPYVYEEHLEDVLQAYVVTYNNVVTKLKSNTTVTLDTVKKGVHQSWNTGVLFLFASLEILIETKKIPFNRVEEYIKFAIKRGVFD